MLISLLSLALAAEAGTPYQAEVQAWRQQREERLKADGGWLSVAGLFWLKPGENAFGSDPSLAVALPAGPARAGTFVLADGQVTLRLEPGVTASVGDQPIADQRSLAPDTPGPPDVLALDRLRMTVIARGDRR